MNGFLLYGAYGYTGRLITRMAADYGLRPTLSGRNEKKLRAMAEEFGFPFRAVSLEDKVSLTEIVSQFKVVLHAAGPFIHTSGPMHQACLATGVHYLDITGEIAAFAAAQSLHAAAKAKGVMLMPGVGFDVVPTDCMAAYLKQLLPSSDHLTLAFAWKGGGVSHGTAMTMVEGLGEPGAVRKNGKIVPVRPAYKVRDFPFVAGKERTAVTIPWGDVFTAYHTTGIPDIETYFSTPPAQIMFMKASRYLGPILRLPMVKSFLRRKVAARPAGPTDEQRTKGEAYIYGEASNAHGEIVRARLRTPEGYTLTAITSLLITRKVLNGEFEAGYQTPAGMYGPDLVMEVPGVVREVV
ncbi:saccharopine dehydrogenase family protein [Neolewinella persica]|uniref:saccharopine dehydrogenase family protein n=1 Tax=Neolewinella persica TaxID=70998 RepID=UPI00035E3353|nr:saccharopine dehydrogenase NADP-binding domain-containing protein [Neolewinella persica]